jgi:predicted CXXCH cytochrome family protein
MTKEKDTMRVKPAHQLYFLSVFIVLFCSLFPCSLSAAGKINCLRCHRLLTKEKFVHQALAMGCPACHTGIDAATVPHRKTTSVARGLSSEQPDLCYGCHDQGMFSKKDVHPAIGMGCTGCHNPHSSKNAKLLKTKPPALCFPCHDKAGFTKKTVHPPVASGDCMTCHNPHSSDEMALLVNKPVEVCLLCHGNITHWPHFSSGIAAGGPGPQDPMRPDKPFYCGSCHEPHSSDTRFLFRFNVRSDKELCLHCHQKG